MSNDVFLSKSCYTMDNYAISQNYIIKNTNDITNIYQSVSSVVQLCLTLCDPMDCSSPGSSVCGILQARIVEYIAIAIPSFLTQRLNLGIQHGRQINDWLSRPMLLFRHSVMSDSSRPRGLQHCPSSLLVSTFHCPSLSPRACSDPHPLNQWCYPTISSSVIPFSSCLQSFPASF